MYYNHIYYNNYYIHYITYINKNGKLLFKNCPKMEHDLHYQDITLEKVKKKF